MSALFAQITDTIVQAIEEGTEAYQMPWHRRGGADGIPCNALSGQPYRGTNIVSLWAAATNAGFSSNRWGTYLQWTQLGAQVRKGARGVTVVFWKTASDREADQQGDDRDGERRFIARAARVFNADQVDGFAPLPTTPPDLNPSARIAGAQAFFDALPAQVWHGSDEAFFDRNADLVSMPSFEQFRSPEAYYSVLGHELVHWTGAKNRLDRNLTGRFGSAAYAVEELVAELGTAFLCAELGIVTEPRRDHAPYIACWLTVLWHDARAIVTAASQAQAAVDYLHKLVITAAQQATQAEAA